jgi:hypothetical protein
MKIEKFVSCPKHGAIVSIEECMKCRFFGGNRSEHQYHSEYIVCHWSVNFRMVLDKNLML